MKTLRLAPGLVLLASSLVVLAAAAEPAESAKTPKPTVTNQLLQRFQQVRERMGALFDHRRETPPPFEARHNPFRTPGNVPIVPNQPGPSTTVATVDRPAPSTSSDSNLSLLQQAVGQLKVSGVAEVNGRSHLVINARPYKQGDVVQTIVQGETVYLRVREISKGSVTLVFNDAEITLRF